MRFKKAVKKATHEVRHRQSDIVAVVEQGLESMRVVKAYGREELEEEHLKQASQAAVDAALKARKIKSLLSPVVSVVVAFCVAFVLYRGSWLILHEAMTIGALTVFLSYLNKFFKPVQDLAKMTNSIAQAAVGVERVQTDPRRRRDDPGEARRARARGRQGRDHFREGGLRLQARLPRPEGDRLQDRARPAASGSSARPAAGSRPSRA